MTTLLDTKSGAQAVASRESEKQAGSTSLLSTTRGIRPLQTSSPNILGNHGFGGHNLERQTVRNEASKRLTVGKEISLSGEISSCEHLVVEGEVRADIIDARLVEITSEGVFNGKVIADSIQVEGRLKGDLKATQSLTVRPGGVVSGKITYSELIVEPGGKIEGTLRHISSVKSGADQTASGKSKSTKSSASSSKDKTDDA